jgi:hypothetical protein
VRKFANCGIGWPETTPWRLAQRVLVRVARPWITRLAREAQAFEEVTKLIHLDVRQAKLSGDVFTYLPR